MKQEIYIEIAIRKDNWFNRYLSLFGFKSKVFTTKLTRNETENLILDKIDELLS